MQDLLSISNFYQIDDLSADKNLIKNTKLEIADMGDILNNTKKNLEDEIDELTERINEIEDDDYMMNTIYFDTDKMKEYGTDLIKLSKEYEELILSLVERLSKVPGTTREWIGESATKFMENIRTIEKENLLHFGNEMSEYGKTLINDAQKVEETLKRCSID